MSVDVSDVTLIIPIHRSEGRRDWLDQTIASFARHAPGARYLVAENDGDVTGAMNDALEHVETEFVLPFGADDLALPDYVQMLRVRCETADAAYPSMRLVNDDLEFLGYLHAEPFCRHRLDRMNFISGASMIRTASVRELGGWRDVQMEDWDLWRRMAKRGMRLRPAPEACMVYRRHAGGRNRFDREVLDRILDGDEPEQVQATFYCQATEATTYWRCQVPARRLPAIVRMGLAGDTDENGHATFPEHEGTAVWQFPASKDRAQAITLMRHAVGIRTLVETDDNYLDTSDALVRRRAGWGLQIGGDSAHSVQGHAYCVREADGVIVTTDHLADRYRQVNPNVYVCPNAIDPGDWPQVPEKPDDGVLRIGWFASLSHDRDEHLVRRALSWASRQKDVQVLVMGVEPPWRFQHGRIPWTDDLLQYFRAMQVLDIGVCPVDRSAWADCRSDLKALEYGMAGALPVVSSSPPYKRLEGTAAPRCSTGREWERTIRHLVTHRDEVKQLAGEFREYVLAERTIDARVKDWEEAIRG